MAVPITVTNRTPELSDCADAWFLDENYDCWCLEDLLYTMKATNPAYQRLSIYVPHAYMAEGGRILPDGKCGAYTAKTAPIVMRNTGAGYLQIPHGWLGGPSDDGPQFLEKGMVYVTCGARGRDSVDENGVLCGKSPIELVDLKTAIRFLRHNAAAIPGNLERIITNGLSAGGAMSVLLGVSGNAPAYDEYLAENGAFMDESDAVFASQVYCPIVDLDHADQAYEWQFIKDPENEASMAGPAGTMTPFQAALSQKLSDAFILYFNDTKLKNPQTGEILEIGADGRSGSGYAYLMQCLEDAASKYLRMLDSKTAGVSFSAADYISGNHTYLTEGMPDPPGGAKEETSVTHFLGEDVNMPQEQGNIAGGPPSLGEMMLRPPKGTPAVSRTPQIIETPGDDKTAWLNWDGVKASISSLDDYLAAHRRRQRPCPAFDQFQTDACPEGQLFGCAQQDYMHFNPDIAAMVAELKEEFPAEYEKYYPQYQTVVGDDALAQRRALLNPLTFADGTDCEQAKHFRIRVGAQDADTGFMIALMLGLKLSEGPADVDYALVWDKPHCMADYPGELTAWMEKITSQV